MKKIKIFSLLESDMDIWKNQDTTYMDEPEIDNEIIPENKNKKIDNKKEEYVFLKDTYWTQRFFQRRQIHIIMLFCFR